MVDQWMQEQGIEFEPSAPYSQKQNGLAERKGRTLMERVSSTILGRAIPDNLWPEILLAMTHVSNLLPTSLLDRLSPYEVSTGLLPQLNHLQVLGSTVYVFIHEEKRKAKSVKWEPRAKRGLLVGYDGYSIYRVYLEKYVKVIRIKDLRIFKDASTKPETSLPIYDAVIHLENTSLSFQPQQDNIPKLSIPKQMSYPQTRSGRISKPPPRYDAGMNNDIQVLMTKLNEVLAVPDWGGHTPEKKVDEIDPLVCLANQLRQEDSTNISHFAYLTNNFDIKEPETYEKAMASDQAEKWAEAMKQEMDSLIQHRT